MTVFESLNNTTEKAVNTAERFIKTSQEYYRLKIFQQLTISMSLVTKAILIGSIFMMALIFAAVASAIAIGDALDSLPLGYLIMAGAFIMVALIILTIRKHIDKYIIKLISKKFFD